MNVYSIKVFIPALFAGLTLGLGAAEAPYIELKVEIMKLIDFRAIVPFKQELVRAKQQFPDMYKDIVSDVTDYIKAAKANAFAQVVQRSNKSRKIAGIKSLACGFTSIMCSLNILDTLYALYEKRNVESNSDAFKGWMFKSFPLILANSISNKLIYYMRNLATIFVPLVLYNATLWTYENAQFAWYGNSKIFEDIRILDEMLTCVMSLHAQ